MDVGRRLEIPADAAKYDASRASSSTEQRHSRNNGKGHSRLSFSAISGPRRITLTMRSWRSGSSQSQRNRDLAFRQTVISRLRFKPCCVKASHVSAHDENIMQCRLIVFWAELG
jgi:hypothetical protein